MTASRWRTRCDSACHETWNLRDACIVGQYAFNVAMELGHDTKTAYLLLTLWFEDMHTLFTFAHATESLIAYT